MISLSANFLIFKMRIITLTSQGGREQVRHYVGAESSVTQSSRGRYSHRLHGTQRPLQLSDTQPPQLHVTAPVLGEDQGNKAMEALYKL